MFITGKQLEEWVIALHELTVGSDRLLDLIDVEEKLQGFVGEIQVPTFAMGEPPSGTPTSNTIEFFLDEMENLDRRLEAGMGFPIDSERELPAPPDDEAVDLAIRAWMSKCLRLAKAGLDTNHDLFELLYRLSAAIAREADRRHPRDHSTSQPRL